MNAPRPFPVDVMTLFVSELKDGTRDWNSLLQEPRFEALRGRQRWFSDQQKGMFYRLLSPPRRESFVEIQAGSGIVSACLSEDYARGYALESRATFAEFIELRFRSGGVRNVEVVRARGTEIPLTSATIDLVAIDEPMSVGLPSSGHPSAKAAVLGTLREAWRCLHPHGRLIMAVDGAWCLPQAFTPAEHSGDSGVPTGPMRRRSPFAYRRLLAQAGFGSARFFVVKPRRQVPIDIFSHHRESFEQLYRKYDSRNRVCRMIKWASDFARVPYLAGYFQPSYYIVGER